MIILPSAVTMERETCSPFPLTITVTSWQRWKPVYAGGGNAGPASWTPFKEYAYSFEPDYKMNVLLLTEKFFDEVNDGKVLLKLHFQSGAVLGYNLSVSESKVVGTAPANDAHAQKQTEGADDSAQAVKETSVKDGKTASKDKTNTQIYYWAAGIALLLIAGAIFNKKLRKR